MDLNTLLSPSLSNDKKSKNRFLYQIGQDYFHIEIWIYSFLRDYPPVQIPFAFVEELVIEETLYDWNTKGFLTLKNEAEMWERGAVNYEAADTVADTSNVRGLFLLRSDSRNRLSIRIFPYTEENNDLVETLPDLWEMNFDFIVYDVEDVTNSKNPTTKLKKLYFQDERFVILSERNVEWSTGFNKNLGASDLERSQSGNEAIPSLLESVARMHSTDGSTLKVGYTNKGFIDKPDIPFQYIIQSEWDTGPSTDESKIFYASPAHSNALQDLNYLLNLTKSTDGFPVLLDYGRHSSDRGWKLHSLSYFFKNSNNNQIEKLLIADGTDPSESLPPLERAYYNPSEVSPIKNFTSGTASIIKNYYYAPMSPIDDFEVKNAPLFSYNFRDGEYKIFFEKNTVQEVLNKAKELAKAGLYSATKNSDPQILLNFNSTKSKGVATKNMLTTQNYFYPDLPTMNAVKNLVFLNQTLNFKVNGLTFRSPGKFLYVDRLTYVNSEFDDRFLGQWMITKISHIFNPNYYSNDVVCTKIDSLAKLWSENDTAY